MRRAAIVSSVIGVVALGLVTGSVAHAQTSASAGAFDKLSNGNQKVASALFQAQEGTTSTPLTLDQIAARKQSGQGWGEVFKSMQAQGLVQEKNLGQVVSKYNHSSKGVVTTASGRVVSAHGSGATNPKANGVSDGSRGSGNSGNAGGSSSGSGASNGKGNAYGASSNSGGGAAHGKGGK
jgi:hypothetical protein